MNKGSDVEALEKEIQEKLSELERQKEALQQQINEIAQGGSTFQVVTRDQAVEKANEAAAGNV